MSVTNLRIVAQFGRVGLVAAKSVWMASDDAGGHGTRTRTINGVELLKRGDCGGQGAMQTSTLFGLGCMKLSQHRFDTRITYRTSKMGVKIGSGLVGQNVGNRFSTVHPPPPQDGDV